MTNRLRPLTERVLAGLPGLRALWIVAWALVPWLNAAANLLLDIEHKSAVWEEGTTLVVLNYAALSFAVLITLWGTARVARRLEELRETARFRGMNSVVGPLAAAALMAFVFAVAAFDRDGWTAAVLRGATLFVIGVALWTFFWTYVSLQVGLDRLGREHLRPETVGVDPSLGLKPIGDVAFTGLWMLLVWLVPVVLTGLPDTPGVVIGTLVLAGGLAAFFVSLRRLHRQMVEVKTAEVTVARDLYAQAYEPVRASPTLETLERQQSLLGAAEKLETRAKDIHEWPLDDRTFTRLVTITTSVIAMIVGRLILDPLGL